MNNILIINHSNKNRINIEHHKYGKLPYISWIDLDTMQGEEFNNKNRTIKPVDLSECTIIIKPLKS